MKWISAAIVFGALVGCGGWRRARLISKQFHRRYLEAVRHILQAGWRNHPGMPELRGADGLRISLAVLFGWNDEDPGISKPPASQRRILLRWRYARVPLPIRRPRRRYDLVPVAFGNRVLGKPPRSWVLGSLAQTVITGLAAVAASPAQSQAAAPLGRRT